MKRKLCNSINLRFICSVLTLLIFITQMSFGVSASSGTIYESESNNTVSTADTTYDDRDNYGAIISSSDVDWWKIEFKSEGIANFWLGDIPSGCDFDMQVYDYTGTKLLAESVRGSTPSELVKIHVRPGSKYYIKIYGFNGSHSVSYYSFRVKRYDLQDAKIFTFKYSGYNSRDENNDILKNLWGMGFGGQEYLNNTAIDAYNSFAKSSVFIVNGHGSKGKISFYTAPTTKTSIFATKNSAMTSSDRAISEYTNSALSNVPLAIYTGCSSGVTSSTLGNMVDETLEKGCFCCIAWTEDIYTKDGNAWVKKFLEHCKNGQNLGNARQLTNDWVNDPKTKLIEKSSISSQYYGASRLWATVIG